MLAIFRPNLDDPQRIVRSRDRQAKFSDRLANEIGILNKLYPNSGRLEIRTPGHTSRPIAGEFSRFLGTHLSSKGAYCACLVPFHRLPEFR